jgi:hypothetical protein
MNIQLAALAGGVFAVATLGVLWQSALASRDAARAETTKVEAERDDALRRLDASREERGAAVESAGQWEAIARDALAQIRREREQAGKLAAEQAAALAAAQAAERDASATLAAWSGRYAAATRAPACAAILAAPVAVACPELGR